MTQVMGVNFLRDAVEAQSVIPADMAVLGVAGTAPLANPTLFPLDTPVLVYTNDPVMIAALGSTGTLADAITAISAQMDDSVAAKVVVVRVTNDAVPANVITNLVGNEANGTGIWAFLESAGDLGITPRLLCVPGYTSQTETGVLTIAVTTPGTGYTADFPVTATGGGGTGFSGLAHVADGAVQSVEIVNPGKGYTTVPTLVMSAGSGTGAAATATTGGVGNQICATMPTICGRLKAKWCPEGPTSSPAAALNWLTTLPRDVNTIHPLQQNALVTVNGSNVSKPLSPYIMALYAQADYENGGVPSHSAANRSILGIVGVTPPIVLDITNDANPGMTAIENHFGIVVKGDNSDGSLSDGGFTFWGTDTLSSDTQWLFANVVRMRDFMELSLTRTLKTYIGKFNLTLQVVQAVVNTMEEYLSGLRSNQDIIDYRISFDPNDNNPSDLRLGFIKLTMEAEEPAPLRLLTIRSRRYAQALTTLVSNIAISLGTLTAA
jgi:phage tail sheath protein FI